MSVDHNFDHRWPSARSTRFYFVPEVSHISNAEGQRSLSYEYLRFLYRQKIAAKPEARFDIEAVRQHGFTCDKEALVRASAIPLLPFLVCHPKLDLTLLTAFPSNDCRVHFRCPNSLRVTPGSTTPRCRAANLLFEHLQAT